VVRPKLAAGIEQMDLALAGIVGEALQRGRPDLASRRIDDPQEGSVVLRVGEETQIGHQVFHLGSGEERGAAAQEVGDIVLAQGLLEWACLMVAAIEDGDVAEGSPLGELEVEDLGDDPLRLVALVLAGQDPRRISRSVLAPEPFFEHMWVVRDQGVGESEDTGTGAVVLLQHDHLEVRVVGLEPGQVLGSGAAPGIDRLVVVADHGKGPARTRELADQIVLCPVGILVFVDQQIADPPLPGLAEIRMLTEHPCRPEYEVVEIHRIVGSQAPLIVGIEACEMALEVVLGVAVGLLWIDEVVLPPRDAVLNRCGAEGIAAFGVAQVLLDEGLAVLGVEQGEPRTQPGPVGVSAQDVETQCMEGGDGETAGLDALDLFPGSLAHLARRFVGEGEGADVTRRDPALVDQVGDLAGDHTCFPGPGPGKDEERPRAIAHGLELSGVESGHAASFDIMEIGTCTRGACDSGCQR
jgi:hypothetical protein